MLYKIGNVYLSSDYNYEEYEPFKVDSVTKIDDNLKIELKYVETQYEFDSLEFITELKYVKIEKAYKNSIFIGWLYTSTIGNFSNLFINKTYDYALFHSIFTTDNKSFFVDLQILLTLFLQCKLILSGNLILHSSCVFIDDEAILFSGPSGKGKSTRANKLIEVLSGNWISGDRPILNPYELMVYGAPWDGKESIHVNIAKKIGVIFQIHRSKYTLIRRVSKLKVREFLLQQLFFPMWDKMLLLKLFKSVDKLISENLIYDLYCDQTHNAAIETYSIYEKYISKIKRGTKMKMNENFEILEIDNDYMAIPIKEEAEKFSGVVALSEEAAFLIKNMKNDRTIDELVDLLISEYNVERDVAKKDVIEFTKLIDDMGLLR